MTNAESTPDPDAVPSYPSLLDLTDRIYVVLGAGQGIGRQSAHALHQGGATVVCVDRDRALADAVAAEIAGHAVVADITRGDAVSELFDDVASSHGAVHGVVDVVGMANSGPIQSVSDESWDAQFDIVLRHVFHTIRFAPPHIARAGGGSLVFIGSLAGLIGVPGQATYGAAKAALHQLVRSTALEFAASGTRVNVVAPGIVMTPRLRERFPDQRTWDALARANPNQRVAMPSDIAAAVYFLSSPMARHVTGQVFSVDGGVSAHVGRPPMAELLRT